MVSSRAKGLIMVISGAALWGLSGTAAQVLFQEKQVTTEWLVAVRMLLSGIALLAISAYKKLHPLSIWKERSSAKPLLWFGLIGMLGVQYTYFASIATGNAATATLLQYLAPIYIVLYSIIKERQKPSKTTSAAILLAIAGTFLLMTNGVANELTVSLVSVIWGVLSGVALAFYTLSSALLLKKWNSLIVVGWGMMIGGAAMCLILPSIFSTNIIFGMDTWLLILFVVVFGTLIAFLLFVESIRHLSPTESSLLSSVEPLSAVAASFVFLHVSFGEWQMVGALCIIGTVGMLSVKRVQKSIS
ncbi:putative inner membrane transporter YicL [Anoxybacillus sp. P3H1B]|uniref:DMT family transporter n=1 Tax=Anoxybacillus sp. P3H1B TaxID=1769293 RepID=UPI0007944573|nr:DMT family transporter [Anoxybacillus sp. P3H1B]KXG09360.1 putative inner membrane transporter YicL [Anoxybacillus sp. P3H1B]